MKQRMNYYNSNSNLQSSIQSDESYILFWNKGGYVAFMEGVYEINGGVEHQNTVAMSVGMIRKMFIPQEATNIELKFYMIDSAYVEVGKEYISKMGQHCYAMWGTIFYPVYQEIKCDFDPTDPIRFDGSLKYIPNQTPCTCINACSKCNINVSDNTYGSIKVTNKGLGIIKFDVTFTFGGKRRLIESPKILALQNRKIKIPLEATAISLSIVIQVGSSWKTVHYENFINVPVSCYEVYGTISNPSCKLVKC